MTDQSEFSPILSSPYGVLVVGSPSVFMIASTGGGEQTALLPLEPALRAFDRRNWRELNDVIEIRQETAIC